MLGASFRLAGDLTSTPMQKASSSSALASASLPSSCVSTALVEAECYWAILITEQRSSRSVDQRMKRPVLGIPRVIRAALVGKEARDVQWKLI